MTLWLDVEDLFHYALHNPRPSGIQRLSFEIYAELYALRGEGVRFCRHDSIAQTLRTVPWDVLNALFNRLLIAQSHAEERVTMDAPAGPPQPGRFRRMVRQLPLELRNPLAQALAAQRQALSAQRHVLLQGSHAFRALSAMLGAPLTAAVSAEPETRQAMPQAGEDVRELLRPGDTFGVLGSPWFRSGYAGFIEGIMKRRGIRTMLLVYDLIPIMRPEWCDRGLVQVFTEWFADFIPTVDTVFAISDATALDVERWAASTGIRVALPIHTIPTGTGFSHAPPPAAGNLPAGLKAGSYALIVSTIEARKNHVLAFRTWRRMVEEMPSECVPTLVFAGRVGWLVSDLMQQLENCAYLEGKIVLVANPTDAELVALYRGCRFTLFPSLYEGWGLPVSESLSFGKLCVASDRTSVPEAGGDFCLYIDPENISAASHVIKKACTDDTLVAAYEKKIREEFQPTPWRHTAETLIRHLRL